MIKDTVSSGMVNTLLRQMGASSIKTKPAHINIIKFDLDENLKISYMYQIREDEGIYLQRLTPCPMMIGKLYNEQDIIHIISNDLRKFKGAVESSNFPKFLGLAANLTSFDKEVENLFLFHNVSFENLDRIDKEIDRIHKLIEEIAEKSEVIE